jgi:putative FmdB family regulatory protein
MLYPMPLFEYECRACHRAFELLVRESTELACPGCHSQDLEKRLSVFAVSASSRSEASARPVGPCGSCGHPDGPGSCSVH